MGKESLCLLKPLFFLEVICCFGQGSGHSESPGFAVVFVVVLTSACTSLVLVGWGVVDLARRRERPRPWPFVDGVRVGVAVWVIVIFMLLVRIF